MVSAAVEETGVEGGAERLSLIFCGEDCAAVCDARCGGWDGALVVAGADFGAERELIFV